MIEIVDRFLQQFTDRHCSSGKIVRPKELFEPTEYALDHGVVSGRGDPGHTLCHFVLLQQIGVTSGGKLLALVAVKDELHVLWTLPCQKPL